MSWDIFVQDLPSDARSIQDIPEDFEPRPIGSPDAVIAGIRSVVPHADFSDPTWGRIDGEDYSIEVSISGGSSCDGFALHVRGGASAARVVHDILEALDLRALDMASDTGFFSWPDSVGGLNRWQDYRDQVVRGSKPEAPRKPWWRFW
ncbi:MAG: hypothetical protein AAF196_07750 [Planctomycetota bacterium]